MPTEDGWHDLRPQLRHVVAVVGLVALAGSVGLISMGGRASAILDTVGSPISGPERPLDASVAHPSDTAANPDIVRVGMIVDVARTDLLVIRTGTLDLQVGNVQHAVDEAARSIQGSGGYVSASELVGEGSDLRASVTYRIPVDRWDAALAGLRALADRVVAAETQTQDVTAQVVDLGARIVNLQATERALQGIMAEATDVSDVLDVQAELTTIRGEIEKATAERKRFQEQAALSTLTVHFGLKPVPAVVATQSGFDPAVEVDKATARLVRVVQKAVTAGIWFGIVWLPILGVLGIVAGIVALAAVRARRAVRPAASAGSG
jgi:Domain of unknown function (DUF4349)